MATDEPLGEDSLVEFLESAVQVLTRFSHLLDELNVIPVPDNDTGSNVVRTLSAAAIAARSADVGEVGADVRRSLFGHASGNSGVILAEALSAATDRWFAVQSSGEGFAQLIAAMAAGARSAVAQPEEGTVLTVLATAADFAKEWSGSELDEVAALCAQSAHRAVLETQNQHPVLTAAGVVDAGGLAGALMLDALAATLAGAESVQPPDWSAAGVSLSEADDDQRVPATSWDGVHRYEVVCTVHASEAGIDQMTAAWLEVGSSLATAGREGTWRAHVHTDRVDQVLEAAHHVGSVEHVAVTDLSAQLGGHRHDDLGFPAATVVDLTELGNL